MAALGSGLGTATGIFKLKEDLRDMLLSEDFLNDVVKRQGSVANMEKPDTHLIDAAVKMGRQNCGGGFGLPRAYVICLMPGSFKKQLILHGCLDL